MPKRNILETISMNSMELSVISLTTRTPQLENIILLILRCIAIFLVGLLLARPFFPNDIQLLGDDKQFERIVLLDDSFSMNVRTGNKSVFESAKEKLKEFVKNLETVAWYTIFQNTVIVTFSTFFKEHSYVHLVFGPDFLFGVGSI